MKTSRILLLGSCLLLAAYAGYALWESPYQRWVIPWGDHEDPPTVCQDGTLLKVAGTSLLALDGATGRRKWTFVFPTTSNNAFGATSPIVGGNDTVFIGCRLQGHGDRLYALNGTTGKKIWARDEETASPLTTDDDRVYMGDRILVAMDARTGRRQWAFQPPTVKSNAKATNTDAPTEGVIYDAACTQKMVFAAYGAPDNRLFACNTATGKCKWSIPLNTVSAPGDSNAPTELAVTRNGLVIVWKAGGGIRALDGSTGHLRWRFDGEYVSVTGDGLVYAATYYGGYITGLDETTGRVEWSRILSKKIGTLALDKNGTLFVGTTGMGSGVYALDAKTGQPQWNFSLTSLSSFPYGENIGVSAGANGMVYAASTDGNLYALKRP